MKFELSVISLMLMTIIYFAAFHGRQSVVYACSEVTKEDPIDVQKQCKLK